MRKAASGTCKLVKCPKCSRATILRVAGSRQHVKDSRVFLGIDRAPTPVKRKEHKRLVDNGKGSKGLRLSKHFETCPTSNRTKNCKAQGFSSLAKQCQRFSGDRPSSVEEIKPINATTLMEQGEPWRPQRTSHLIVEGKHNRGQGLSSRSQHVQRISGSGKSVRKAEGEPNSFKCLQQFSWDKQKSGR